MKRLENTTYREGDLPSLVRSTVFYSCKFIGKIPSFSDCEFHDCDLSSCKITGLIECSLFSTKLDGADFSEADVRFSKTNAGSPCTAYGAEWQGVCCTLDCGWFQGIKASESDAEIFLIMALLPETPLKSKLYKTFSDELKRKTKKRLLKEWRKRT